MSAKESAACSLPRWMRWSLQAEALTSSLAAAVFGGNRRVLFHRPGHLSLCVVMPSTACVFSSVVRLKRSHQATTRSIPPPCGRHRRRSAGSVGSALQRPPGCAPAELPPLGQLRSALNPLGPQRHGAHGLLDARLDDSDQLRDLLRPSWQTARQACALRPRRRRSPCRARPPAPASIAASSASRLVWSAMSEITRTISPMRAEFLPSPRSCRPWP